MGSVIPPPHSTILDIKTYIALLNILINVENPDKEIRDRKLLKDVSFNIKEGVGFIDANGERRSTILNIITGKDRFYTGSVKLKTSLSYSFMLEKVR